ncbi:unnamed protein product, partial [Prunus brigantina]
GGLFIIFAVIYSRFLHVCNSLVESKTQVGIFFWINIIFWLDYSMMKTLFHVPQLFKNSVRMSFLELPNSSGNYGME